MKFSYSYESNDSIWERILHEIEILSWVLLMPLNGFQTFSSGNIFLLFLIHVMVEKVLFWGWNFKMENLMVFHVMRTPEFENHIFSVWSVCVCVCPCVCDGCQHNSKTNNRKNTKLGILHLYHTQMLLETFNKNRTKLCVQGHSKVF